MQLLSLSDYQALIEGSEALTSERVDGRESPKVLRLKDQSILKLFRLKRLITSARLVPHTTRFQNHADKLRALGIPTVDIKAIYNIAAIKRTAVQYHPLEGLTLREHCQRNPLKAGLAKQLGLFFQFLHAHGIYFRSIHFGNMVRTPQGHIGLIDIVDMRFRKSPLNLSLRIRNLRHLLRYDTDIACLAPVRHLFLDAYCNSSRLPRRKDSRLRRQFEAYFPDPTAPVDKRA
jgi:hypothetical protein